MDTKNIERLKVVCINIATGRADTDNDFTLYKNLRSELLKDAILSPYIPSFINDATEGEALFTYLQALFPNSAERRSSIRENFAPLEEKAKENGLLTGLEKSIEKFNSNSVKENWRKMVERAPSDPSGCVTSARALIESTLKHILKELDIETKKNPDIKSLFHDVKERLFPNFPAESNEVKSIIGSIAMVIDKVKLVRDEFGDAHGHLDSEGTLTPLFAKFIANMSGSVCGVLIEALEEYKKSCAKL